MNLKNWEQNRYNPERSPIFQCIFKIFQIKVDFILFFLKYSAYSNVEI